MVAQAARFACIVSNEADHSRMAALRELQTAPLIR